MDFRGICVSEKDMHPRNGLVALSKYCGREEPGAEWDMWLKEGHVFLRGFHGSEKDTGL